jgi:hypothetical protein
MKQGRATHSSMGSTKVEPNSRGVSPCSVAQIGIMQGNHVSDGEPQNQPYHSKPLYEGRGLKAPMVGETSHRSGSQGRH